jgi:photosystem II stability/assembly factor-like uncharacterized protein
LAILILMRKTLLALLSSCVAASAASPDLFNALRWRHIGPFRGGRVDAVAGVPGDATTFYFGSVGGGVWKTGNAGMTWAPIFDAQPVASIGAIAVATSDPNILYVGTGETDIRSQIGYGDGVYKSTDAGKTWTNVGLRDTKTIARILVDARNPDLVYVAALGHVYGPNQERGVFRSTDGGRSWRKVLYTTPDTGAADLVQDPANPRVIFATLWNAHRPPWSQYGPIEGPGSGLWKTTDGGDHWTQASGHGLPTAMWRRSGLSFAAGGRRIYLLVDAQSGGGIYRSDDGGENWAAGSTEARITSRNWYFGTVTADPRNPDVVYVPNVALYRSVDGGKSFTVLKGAPGGDDYQRLWIDPAEPRRMILCADQGTVISLDGGASWSSWYNQPTAQMYHIIADNRYPYVLYGSQQDSGTAAVPSRTDHLTIDARDWFSVGGAESGYIAIDPKDNDILYVGNTGGSLSRFDRRSGQAQNITPWPVRVGGFTGSISAQKYRFPWTAPLIFSPIEPNTLYYGAQILLKTVDGGLTWSEISPDLTGDTRQEKKPAAVPVTPENAIELGYGVIYAIAASPLKAGLIWVGTDTGLLHLTQNGGRTWQNVTPQGLPRWSRVTQLEASRFDAGTAWATVDRRRMDDYRPYIYRTHDFGASWTLVANGLDEPAVVNGIREDPARKGLLYAATEFGVAVSFDDGDHWQTLQLNLPAVSVRDLVVHGDDLAIGTHGRGFWILDNVTPLRQAEASADITLYKPARAIRLNPEGFFGTPFPPEEPQAQNPPAGAVIDYYLRTPAAEVKLEILDAKGQAVRSFSSNEPEAPRPARRQEAIAEIWIAPPARLTVNRGLNRFVWDLKNTEGVFVLPGTYQARLTANGGSLSQPLTVEKDPRSRATAQELARQYDFSMRCAKAIHRAEAAGMTQAVLELTTALAVAQSADRTPPAAARAIYEEAIQALNGRPPGNR